MNKQHPPCLFCQKCSEDGSFTLVLKRALYCKYSQSQNYYYEKTIKDLVDDNRVSAVILFKDQVTLHECVDYLKRFYKQHEITERFPALQEYYKYHINMPRIFHCKVVVKRHEKTRQIQYKRIKKELGIEEGSIHQQTIKAKDPSEDRSVRQMKHLLKELKILETNQSQTQSTILKDLVQQIGEPIRTPKPFQLIQNHKELSQLQQKKPILDTKLNLHLMKTIQQQIQQIKGSQTSRIKQPSPNTKFKVPVKCLPKSKPPSTERQNINTKMKSRVASIGNFELSKSSNISQFAKQLIQSKIATMSKKTTNNNFFVKGFTKNLYLEELKNSMRSLRSRNQTPSRSNATSPQNKKK